MDRRWIALASGLLALWLQFIAPLAMAGLMQPDATSSEIAAVLCQQGTVDGGKQSPLQHGKASSHCQICLTLQQLAASGLASDLAPAIVALPVAHHAAPDAWTAPLRLAQASFSSRAPPIL